MVVFSRLRVDLVYLVNLVCLVFWLNETNQMNQINQINKKPNNGLLLSDLHDGRGSTLGSSIEKLKTF